MWARRHRNLQMKCFGLREEHAMPEFKDPVRLIFENPKTLENVLNMVAIMNANFAPLFRRKSVCYYCVCCHALVPRFSKEEDLWCYFRGPAICTEAEAGGNTWVDLEFLHLWRSRCVQGIGMGGISLRMRMLNKTCRHGHKFNTDSCLTHSGGKVFLYSRR